MTFDEFKNVRDEQFWFTAAVVGFNGVLLSRAEVPAIYAVLSSTIISLFGVHLIMTRWIAAAGRWPDNLPDAKTANWRARWAFTLREFKAEREAFPYVVAEMSGSFFYLLLMLLSFLGVLCKHAVLIFRA